MRSTKSIFLGLVGAVAACGGDDGIMNPIDATPTIDASTVDAPPAGCRLNPAYPDPLSLGQEATPFAFMRPQIDHDNMPGTPPVHIVAVIGELNEADPPQGTKGLFMLFLDTIGQFAAPNDFAAGPPLNTALPLDGGATCGACLEGYTNYTAMGGNPDLATATQIFLAQSGTVTFTQFQPAVIGQPSNVFGSYDNIMFQGFEPDPGDPNMLIEVPGCTSSFTKLNFFFQPTWQNMAVAPTGGEGKGLRGVQPLRAPIR
jgi:hypothetical protein